MRTSPNYDVIKEPRGFIKCLEVFLAIFAFACATGYRGSFQVKQSYLGKSHNGKADFKYPFDGAVTINLDFNQTKYDVEIPIEQRSSTEFFVTIGVFCFLYSVVMVVYYVFFEEDNSRNASATSSTLSPPVIDFAFGSFWALFWFFSACAFAAAVHSLKDATDVNKLIAKDGALHKYCSGDHMCDVSKAKYATLTVAILLGFLNVFVWAGNIWFLWKETPWHSKNNQPPATVQPPQQTPQAAAI